MKLTLQEILNNESLRRHEFPAAGDKIFLSHAAVCPLPRRVTEAMKRYLDSAGLDDQETVFPLDQIRHTRHLAAQLLGVTPEEIALVGPTSQGLSLVAAGLAFKPGDNVLVYHDDYPSNVYPWMALAAKDVEVRFLKPAQYGQIDLDAIQRQVDSSTRLVALSSCHFISGYRPDLEGIASALRDRDILLCVDGIQTLGAFPTPARDFDFLAADAHKWLLGPCAAGLLYVRRDRQDQVSPLLLGWHNLRCPSFVALDTLAFRQDARRYEAGTANLAGLAGLHAALELLLEIGIDTIASELLRKRAWLLPALQAKGYTVLAAESPQAHASSILSFHHPQSDLNALHRRLAQSAIVTSLRRDRSGQDYLRISPHFYNTDAELERFLSLI